MILLVDHRDIIKFSILDKIGGKVQEVKLDSFMSGIFFFYVIIQG